MATYVGRKGSGIGPLVWPGVLACATLLLAVGTVGAQPAPSTEAEPEPTVAEEEEEEGPLVSDSTVGYIDTAIIGNQVRFRFDSAYNIVQPARAEFLWPVDGKFGIGPGADTSVDYQDLSLYAEWASSQQWSAFVDLPVRLLDPTLLDNTAGLGDMNFGIKYGLHQNACTATTLQFRVYVPTADADRGLGTNHVSLEPALLHYSRLTSRLACFAELRDWIAVDGSPTFFGNVLRYGLGASWQVNDDDCHPLSAVAEFVGWTVLEGRTAITTAPGVTTIADATGDTIVNAKLGARWRFAERFDAYCGYGRVLTEQTWYDDIVRFEVRWFY
ncbi:MAG: transporter [Pirellulales bacterium]